MTSNIIPSDNPDYGLFGTIAAEGYAPDAVWEQTFEAMSSLHVTDDAPLIRDYLDGRAGRHLANDILARLDTGADLQTSIAAAIPRPCHRRAFRRLQIRYQEG